MRMAVEKDVARGVEFVEERMALDLRAARREDTLNNVILNIP